MFLWRSIPHRRRTLYGGVLIGALLTLFMLFFLQNRPFFVRAEEGTYDWQFQHRGALANPSNIVVVGVDGGSISFLDNGDFPPRRARLADAINFLHKAGAKVIVNDFEYFNDSHYGHKDDLALAHAVKRAGNVVLVEVLQSMSATNNLQNEFQLQEPLDILASSAARLGVANVPQWDDGTIRSAELLQAGPDGKLYPTEALQAASLALHESPTSIARRFPESTLINYVGPRDPGDASNHTFLTTQFASAALAEDDPKIYRNKIVFIVPDAVQFADLHTTPYGPMYGGYIQANILNTILQNNPINDAGDRTNDLILILIGLVTAFLASRFGILHSSIAALVLAVLYPLASIFAFSHDRLWLHLVTPEAGIVLVFAGVMAFRFATEERQRRRTHKLFGQYVKPEVVDILVDSTDDETALQGALRPVSTLFVDIRGFTAMSEKMDPQNVIKFLDIYLEDLTESVQKYTGTMNKYVGDELMAMWNAPFAQPDHPLLAVRCGLDMVARMDKINDQLSGLGLPRIRYGIGVNSGDAVVGSMGSSFRKQYDVVGDCINTAARLCSAAAGGEVIIGQATWELIGNWLVVEETEPLRLKGKSQPLRTFKVLQVKDAAADAPEVVLLDEAEEEAEAVTP